MNVNFTLAQCIPVNKHLSQMHQRFRVGSCCATKQSSICHGSGASLSEATGGDARKSPRRSTGPLQKQQLHLQQTCERTWSPQQIFTSFQQELRQEMTDVIQQLRLEMHGDGHWESGHLEQHQHSTPECFSKFNCFQAIPNQ